MREQEGVRQRTDPTGHRRDRGSNLASRFEVDIPHDLAVDDVDADVDDDCSVAEHRARDEAWMAGRHHHDLGILDMMAEVASSPVTDRHGRVLADEQERGRHTHHGRATDYDCPSSFDLDPGPPQDLDRGMGRCRQEAVIA